MSARVERWCPAQEQASMLYVGKPYTTGIASRAVDRVNHLLGYDLPAIHSQSWGSTEIGAGPGTATYRFLYQAHPNVRALYFSFAPRGHVSSANHYGSIDVPGAETVTPQLVGQQNAGIADLGDLETVVDFVLPVTAGAFAEVTYVVTDLMLHSVEVWEVPRGFLSGTQYHVDREFAWSSRYIDDESAGGAMADARGHPQLLRAIDQARDESRRHLTSFVNPAPVATNPVGAAWTNVTGWDNLRIRGRQVVGSAVANEMPFRCFIYASVTGGTWEFRMVGTNTSAGSAGFGGAAAWRPGVANLAAGLAWQVPDNATDTFAVQVRQTVGGAGETLSMFGLTMIEEPV